VLALGLIVAAVAVTAGALALTRGGGSATGANGGAPAGEAVGSAQSSFAFGAPKVVLVRISTKSQTGDVSAPAAQIAASLDALYGQGIADQARWRSGPATNVWNAFAPSIRDRARADRTAFTVGKTGASLQSLEISSSRLTIRFLLDEKGRATSAIATALVTGAGTVKGSGPVTLEASGRFFFEPVNGAWLITGYPDASVNVNSSSNTGGGAAPTSGAGASP
jgi:hypothetical protein